MGSLRRLFDLFEQKTQLMRLLDVEPRRGRAHLHRRRKPGRALRRAVHRQRPYEVDGQVVGTLGVIGPTRMAYDRMIQIVDILQHVAAAERVLRSITQSCPKAIRRSAISSGMRHAASVGVVVVAFWVG